MDKQLFVNIPLTRETAEIALNYLMEYKGRLDAYQTSIKRYSQY